MPSSTPRLHVVCNVLAPVYLWSCVALGSHVALNRANHALFTDRPLVQCANTIAWAWGMLNVVGNYVATVLVDVTVFRDKAGVQPPDPIVQVRPCHWCPLCSADVVDRDHHCYFSRACIARANEKYFVLWTSWLCVGCLYTYACLLCLVYVDWWDVDRLSFMGMFVVGVPPFRWMMGTLTGEQLLLVLVMHMALMGRLTRRSRPPFMLRWHGEWLPQRLAHVPGADGTAELRGMARRMARTSHQVASVVAHLRQTTGRARIPAALRFARHSSHEATVCVCQG